MHSEKLLNSQAPFAQNIPAERGRAFLHDLLRNDGILPLYEQAYDPVDGLLR